MRKNKIKDNKDINMVLEKESVKKVRVYNPVINTYYYIRQKSESAGRKGTIVSKWSEKGR